MARIIDNPKENIISVTREIMQTEGINKVNMRSIAKRCNIALGTIYNYFPTKIDIIIEIIEVFWIDCFKEIDLNILKEKDFFVSLEYLYNVMNNHLNNFKINWLDQLSQMSDIDKSRSRSKEKEYIHKVLFLIEKLIERNKDQFNTEKFSSLNKEQLAMFIFDNFMIMLKRNDPNYSFFDTVLKKLLQ